MLHDLHQPADDEMDDNRTSDYLKSLEINTNYNQSSEYEQADLIKRLKMMNRR